MDELSKEEKKQFYKRFDSLDKGMIRILSILEKDDAIGEKGLVYTVHIMERKLEELLTREKIYKAKATTWGIVGGALGTSIIWFGKYIMAKLFVL